ncbi:MAG: Ig-like domain-containing protein [Oscillospiraceae bacterium]|nr:Ig-like domain-containing protein [Oscillospiraceae bacterium]
MNNKVIRITIIVLSALLALLVLAVIIVYNQRAAEPDSDTDYDSVEETPGLPLNEIEVASIRVVLESYEIYRGTRFMPEVIILPDNATDKDFTLHSDNERVVRQQGNNWVAVEVGTANLIATASNGITGMAVVVVIAPEAEFMSFQEEEVTLDIGEVFELIPTFIPRDAGLGGVVVYTSVNERVATVTSDGKISAVGPGTTTIRGTVGDVSAEIKVTVEIQIRSIIITMNRRVFAIGERAEFSIQVEPENATNSGVSVSFSGAAVTSTGVNSFRCDEAGEVTVTFTSDSNSSISRSMDIIVHDLAVLADEVFRLTNIERANSDLTPVGRIALLTQVAQLRVREISEPNQFSHTRPDGRAFQTAFNDIGLQYTYAGENLAAGQESPAEAVRAWMESTTGHRETILDSDFGNLGVAVTIDGDGRLYWVQIFMN